MKSSELLQQALSLFEGGRCWGKGAYKMRKEDASGKNYTCYCSVGALQHAEYLYHEKVVQTGEGVADAVYVQYDAEALLNQCIPEEARALGNRVIIAYNDDEDTTFAKVEAVFTCAIKNAQAAEMESAQ